MRSQRTYAELDNFSAIEFEHISIDSRSLQNGNTTLFFCLKGQELIFVNVLSNVLLSNNLLFSSNNWTETKYMEVHGHVVLRVG